jgi:hypothetical protein
MKLTKLFTILSLAVAVFGVSSAAQSQAPRGPPCIARAQLIAQLNAMFGEQAIGRGLAQGGFVLELFAGQSGSWTVVATTPQGMSCFVAAGEGWEPLPGPNIFAGQ